MYNLLSAGIMRLLKSKLFWLLCVSALLWSAVIYFLLWDSVEYFGEIYLNVNAGFYFMMPLFYIGVAEAVFCAFFIGTDYSDGTIRNKLFTGHKRTAVYLSNFALTSFAGICFCLAHIAALVLVGLPLIGTGVFTAIPELPLRLLCEALIVLANSAIFTLLSMLNSNKTAAAVVGILLSFVIIVSGVMVYSALKQPEFYSMDADGSTVVPNPRYIKDGAAREALEWLSASVPFSASMEVIHPEGGKASARVTVCQFGLTAVLTAVGVAAFRKKDVK